MSTARVRGAQQGAASAPRRTSLPRSGAALVHQLRFDLKMQWRNPAAIVFTLVLPIGFLILFAATAEDASARASYVPACMVIGVFSGSLTNLAITLTYLREYGMLKQARLLPIPAWVYLSSRALAGALLALGSAALVGGAGWLLYGAVPTSLANVAGAVVLGTAIGSGLGLLVSALVRSEVAATPIANAVTLPLLVMSGAFFPLDTFAPGLRAVAEWLPGWGVTALAGLGYGVDTATATPALLWVSSLLWTLVAVGAGLWRFRWAPTVRR